ncbi:glycoside hydrolase 3 [Didymosphaeria variabile]|uniref:beta-glucosidase n=1 Tax=Didymosphaeria variabile TaxID=1932322 RepID=A0A9W8XSH8_9PLEO|nr:glycoside hydrolase 3 [Didymosphaeria variabile]KAJ4356420.1 glycoside hydrolase 3 [Didymosphaeria variabile]
MDDLDDELDLRYHRGLKPDVYYRCPSSESLDGALRNEFEKNAASLIPVDIVTEFVFGKASTITVPVTQQPRLDTLFEPADYPQSITVEHALCHGIEGKERLKLQRAIARCFIESIQIIDGFKYTERQAWNKDGADGVRFKYVCLDSLQNRDRKSNGKKKNNNPEDADSGNNQEMTNGSRLPMYDCGGAVHVRFSTKREAVNVMYVHNPIHRDVESRPANHDSAKLKKRKKSKIDHHVEVDSVFHGPDSGISASPEVSKVSAKKKRKKEAAQSEASGSTTKKKMKSKQAKSPSKARQKAPVGDLISEPVQPVKGKCLRCREKALPSDQPSKRATISWDDAYAKATTALAKLSLSDKVGIVSGTGWQAGNCVGNTKAAGSIGYPSLCLQDGPLGVRYINGATSFAAGIHAASTWDVDLIRERGTFLGQEAKQLGIHVQLGPVAGPMGKIPTGGRNWEGFGADPYLVGIAMRETIQGMQEAGVQACAKHYIGNEQERNRETMSSAIPDRVMHELYLWPFADSVQAGVASVMCSYNKINGTYACENGGIMNKLLKDELGFKGYVMSDWNAQHTTAGSANGGLDMTMPGSDFNKGNVLWGPALQSAVSGGQVQQSRVDDMVKRILAAWYKVGQDKGYPTATFNSWKIGNYNVGGNHKDNVRKMARDGIVLLKNTDNALPLKKPKSIAVIGSDSIVAPKGANACADRGCNDGTLAVGWGSGAIEFPYLIAPLDAIKTQAQQDGTTITTSTTDNAQQGASAAQNAEVAIVHINSDSGEGYITVEGNVGDRKDLNPWHNGNDLVKAVAAVNKKTIVVIHSVGPLILEPYIDTPNVVAVVWAGLPGQESGNGLVDILYGAASPSGKLPYTIAKQPSDYGTAVTSGDDASWDLFIDYRRFDKNNITPRFEFGFGLSYTNFTYDALAITGAPTAGPATGTKAPGGPADLFETVATVTAKITNSGGVAGAEVPQLYIGYPANAGAPPKQLRGFNKINLAVGASGAATFKLRRRDLSVWDGGQWVVPTGEFGVFVGSSSRDVRLTGKITT